MRSLVRDRATGDWVVRVEDGDVTYAPTSTAARRVPVPVSRYAPYEVAEEAARRAGLLDDDEEE